MKKYAIEAQPRCLYPGAPFMPVFLGTTIGFIDQWYKCLCPFCTKYGLPIGDIDIVWELKNLGIPLQIYWMGPAFQQDPRVTHVHIKLWEAAV